MRKGLVKAVVLLSVFVLSLICFGRLANHTNEDLTTEMADATLPVLSLYTQGREINELHGYVSEMDASYMRDTITPIGEDRILPITIQTYQMNVDTISYEIRSLDAKRLIANAQMDATEEKKGRIEADLQIQNLLTEGEEYLLIIKLSNKDTDVYYYTRIIEAADSHVDECLAFVQNFHDSTFDAEKLDGLSTYMEQTTADNDTLHTVSLNSSLKQIGWAQFEPKKLTDPVVSVKEITDTYTVVVLDYVVTGVGEEGQSEYYNIEEYYRVRYASGQMYLLNFERTMDEIFRGENNSFSGNSVWLGIRAEDVDYKTNEAGNIVTFVQEGELWCYNVQENTLSKVFSFLGYEGVDTRENYGEHEIKTVRIDEAGSVDYIVYGYMNRGIHEGQVGIAIYHYDSVANTNEELVFVPSDRSYEVMKSELGQLMYVNEGGTFYLMVDGTVYGIDTNTLETRELIRGLESGNFAVSDSNRYVAWTDGTGKAETIHVMDLGDESTFEVAESSTESLKPLGFMGEDFVYGVVENTDIYQDMAGNEIYPMCQVKIIDTASKEHEELKVYEKSGYFVSGIEIEGYTMYLNRIQYNGTAYVDAEQDMIMNREGDTGKVVSVDTTSLERKERMVELVLSQNVNKKAPKLLTPKETILEESRNVTLKDEDTTECFYVYVKGDVLLSTERVADAILKANENMGVVVDDSQNYIWKRSRSSAMAISDEIVVGTEDEGAGSIAQCINAMLESKEINISVSALIDGGETPKDILKNTMKDVQVLDLTGCTVDEVLYYVSCGSPVFAMTASNEAVLVVGYDASNITVFDPAIGKTRKKETEEADLVFSEAGNVFFTYLD